MATIAEIKKERDFYRHFASLIEVLKAIAISRYHALEKKIRTFEEFADNLESFFDLINVKYINHPFVNAQDRPMGVVAVTSDTGLLGGLNHRIVIAALNYLRNRDDKLIVLGIQGQAYTKGLNVVYKTFPGINDENRVSLALELRNFVSNEVLANRLGAVKVIYPFALSVAVQQIVELPMLPCVDWKRKQRRAEEGKVYEVLMESHPADMIEYLVYLWMGQKFFEIFQLSSLAEFAARVVHLEESSQKIKGIEKKLQLKYFRARHEAIDQQMRELFSARR